MGEIYKSLKKQAKEADGVRDAGDASKYAAENADEDSARKIYKLPTLMDEPYDAPMAADNVKSGKRKRK